MGLPLLAAIFLQVNALVIGFMVLAFFVHEATALWDVHYAVSAREVSPWEQHVHSFLEMTPLMAILLVCSLHWPQLLALVGQGPEQADFSLRWKGEPLPVRYLAAILTAILVLEVFPYLEELWRGLRRHPGESMPPAA